MSDSTKRMSLETAGIDDLVMLDGTPDDSALDSVLLPQPTVQKKLEQVEVEVDVDMESPDSGDSNEVDLDLAADLNFTAPRDTAGYAVAAVITRLEESGDEVPEAGALPRDPEVAPPPQLDDVPEAGAMPGPELVVPEMGPQCGPTASPDPAAAAAGMGFLAVDAVDDEPDEPSTQPRKRSGGGFPHIVVLIFGIVCLAVAMVGLFWFTG